MKKIALLSVHNDPNYGSVLQAYALAYAIKREGYDCEYINYSPIPKDKGLLLGIKHIVKNILIRCGILKEATTEYSFWQTAEFQCQRKLFVEFHDAHIPFSRQDYFPSNIALANKVYDFFIVGSDQMWSPYATCQKNNISFLEFVENNKCKGSYAPSLGTCHLTEGYVEKLRDKLSGFIYLSCREKHNAEFLSEKFGRKVQHVLDPSLLLNRFEWQLLSEPFKMPEKYILCYILGTKQCITDFAERLGQLIELPVYYIVSRPEYMNKKNALKDLTPGQFIFLVSRSSYIVTDSFHGILFSIIFQRQFYAFTKRDTLNGGIDNDRIIDLLSFLHIENRLIEDDHYKNCECIDYDVVNLTLSKYLSESCSYLRELLRAV